MKSLESREPFTGIPNGTPTEVLADNWWLKVRYRNDLIEKLKRDDDLIERQICDEFDDVQESAVWTKLQEQVSGIKDAEELKKIRTQLGDYILEPLKTEEDVKRKLTGEIVLLFGLIKTITDRHDDLLIQSIHAQGKFGNT